MPLGNAGRRIDPRNNHQKLQKLGRPKKTSTSIRTSQVSNKNDAIARKEPNVLQVNSRYNKNNRNVNKSCTGNQEKKQTQCWKCGKIPFEKEHQLICPAKDTQCRECMVNTKRCAEKTPDPREHNNKTKEKAKK